MLAIAQAAFSGYQVRLISKIEAHSQHIRFSWAGGMPREGGAHVMVIWDCDRLA
jgi:hypothetical protein